MDNKNKELQGEESEKSIHIYEFGDKENKGTISYQNSPNMPNYIDNKKANVEIDYEKDFKNNYNSDEKPVSINNDNPAPNNQNEIVNNMNDETIIRTSDMDTLDEPVSVTLVNIIFFNINFYRKEML